MTSSTLDAGRFTSSSSTKSSLSPRNIVILTIVLGTLIRIALNSVLGYGNGEGYYLASARHLALSYFDQPPLSLWIAHYAIELFGTSSILLPRLPYILVFALTTWQIYRLGARLFGEAAGAWSAVILNVAPVFAVSVGAWVQPDATLFLFMAVAANVVVELCFGAPKQPMRLWILAGVAFGLAMLSKYHAALVLAGLVIFVATTPGYRKWFFHPGLLVAAVISAVIFAPVMIWNVQNHFASFGFQGDRIVESAGLRFDWLGRSILGQWVWIGVVVWPMLMVAYGKALWRGPRDPKTWFLCCLAILPIIIFTAAALWAPLGWHFHWQAPGYVFLFPLLGKVVADGIEQGRTAARNWLVGWTIALSVFAVLAGAQAATGWSHGLMPLLPQSVQAKPYWDTNPTRELLEWRPLRPALAERGLLGQERLFVITGKWFDAGKADVVVGDKLPVVCLTSDPRNIAFGWDDRAFLGWDALIVAPVSLKLDAAATYGAYFDSIEPLADVTVPLGGETAEVLKLYRAHTYKQLFPLPYGVSRG